MPPAEGEVVTVVLKPEPGGQARLRFVTPASFIPLSDLQASNASESLEFVSQVFAFSLRPILLVARRQGFRFLIE